MRALEIRKELLIAEAEVLRAQMSHDMDTIRRGITGLGVKARSVTSITMLAGSVIAAFSAFRSARKPAANGSHSSFLGSLLTGARAASAVWLSLRSSRG